MGRIDRGAARRAVTDVREFEPNRVSALLAPRNVVLVGATDRPGHWSARVWQNLVRFGFSGPVYLVNPGRESLWGARCYASLDDLPEPPDHLALFVPAEISLQVLEAGAELGARSATLFAAGFGEGGDPAGAERAGRLGGILSRTGIAVAGPNCMGVASGRSRFVTIPDETLPELAPGPVAVVTQSGMMCSAIHRAIRDTGLQSAHLVSCGNQTGLQASDYIRYFADDPDVRVILCYLEGLPDADRFLAAASRVRERKKALVVVKIGGSDEGREAALAHTGSLVGSLDAFDAFAAGVGVLRFDAMEEALEAVSYLARAPLPRRDGLALMTISGALKSLAHEAASREGLTFAPLSPETRARLQAVLGEDADIANPLDTKRTLGTAQYIGCIEALCAAPEIGMLLIAEDLPREAGVERKVANLRALAEHLQERGPETAYAPVAAFLPLPLRETEFMATFREEIGALPVLRDTGKAVRVAGTLLEFRRVAAAAAAEGPEGRASALSPSAEAVDAWRARAAKLDVPSALNEAQSKALLGSFGVSVPNERVLSTPAEAAEAAADIGFPVVLKAVSSGMTHKSDAGLVVLGLTDAEAVSAAAVSLLEKCDRLEVHPEGLLVAEQVSGGTETVLGLHRDPEMGLVSMFGMGGVWLELFRDVAFSPPVASRASAREVIGRTRAARLLAGYRGGEHGDVEAVVDALLALGRLAQALGDCIEFVDINPFLVLAERKGGVALDSTVVLRPPGEY